MAGSFAVDGVISGLTTSDIIAKLMNLERRPLTLLQQQQDKEKTRAATVTAIQSGVGALRTAMLNLMKADVVNAKQTSVTGVTNADTYLTASATAAAVAGSFKVNVSQLASSTFRESSGPIGAVINPTATLANAGFRFTPIVTKDGQPATFSINGRQFSVNATTTLDNGTATSLVGMINAANIGVTASLVPDAAGRPNNRIELVSAPGTTLQLGALGDTSNVLRLLNLSDAVVQGDGASTVAGSSVAAGALNTSVTINGITTQITQSDTNFTAQQNAAFIANAINTTANSTVNAIDNGDGTIDLRQRTAGAAGVIDITNAGSGTGFSVGATQNGTDKLISTAPLGVVDLAKPLAQSRLATPISGLGAGGNGSFTLNGVAIAYKDTESIETIMSRINNSSAGVTAFYDATRDQIRLSATTTGARAMTLSDTTGNFLAATGLLNGAQTLGKNATFTIEGVNNGQPLSSSTNTVTGYVPGVTLQLKQITTTPLTVTVSQDTGATSDAIKGFIDAYNGVLDQIDKATNYDPKTKTASTLTGDAGIRQLQRSLRRLVSDTSLGGSSLYQTFAAIGVSTGAVGSAVGSTNRLTLDETKLANALRDNPQAVANLLGGFTATLGAPGGVANVTSVTGTPTNQHEDGVYHLKVLDAQNNVEVTFVTNDGRTTYKSTQVLTPGSENYGLIPGVKITAAASLTVGSETTIGMTVTSRGIAVKGSDYLGAQLDKTGLFGARADSSAAIQKTISDRINQMQDRLDRKEAQLKAQFTALETTMQRLQAQSAGLSASLAKAGASTG